MCGCPINNGPNRLLGFHQRDKLQVLARKFAHTFQYTYNKYPDQTVWMRRLVYTFDFLKPLKVGFLAWSPLLM